MNLPQDVTLDLRESALCCDAFLGRWRPSGPLPSPTALEEISAAPSSGNTNVLPLMELLHALVLCLPLLRHLELLQALLEPLLGLPLVLRLPLLRLLELLQALQELLFLLRLPLLRFLELLHGHLLELLLLHLLR